MNETVKIEDIFSLVRSDIDSLYNQYSYVNISIDEYYKLVLQQINKLYKNEDIKLFKIILTDNLNKVLKRLVKEQLNNPDVSFIICNNFINNNCNGEKNYKDSLKQIQVINSFFKDNFFTPDLNLLNDLLIKNTYLYNIAESIFKNNEELITNGNAFLLSKDDFLTTILEIYCDYNNIKIDYENEDFSENEETYYIDSTKKYLDEMRKHSLLTKEEERELFIKITHGDKLAKNKVIESNLKLVFPIAKRLTDHGIDFLELIQEGNIGLMIAVDKFDYTKGYKFSTYATWWIRNRINRFITNNARTIRIPVHMVEKIRKMNQIKGMLFQELNREPTEKEIARKMNTTVEKVREVFKASRKVISLEMAVGEEKDSYLKDCIPDKINISPEEYGISKVLKEEINNIFQTLSKREQKILDLRFGLTDGTMHTLNEVGNYFNITRERVRQIEVKALRKLRSPRSIQMLDELQYKKIKNINPDVSINLIIKTYNKLQDSSEKEIYGLYYGFTKKPSSVKDIALKFGYSEDYIRAVVQKIKHRHKKIINQDLNKDIEEGHKLDKISPYHTKEEMELAYNKLPENNEKEIYGLYYGFNCARQYSANEIMSQYDHKIPNFYSKINIIKKQHREILNLLFPIDKTLKEKNLKQQLEEKKQILKTLNEQKELLQDIKEESQEGNILKRQKTQNQ